jgi:Spy/CpxP family protein refolding chaperone
MFGGRGPMGFPGVELTDAQREQIRAIVQEERAGRQAPPAGADLHRQLRAELLTDTPDEQKIASLRDQLAAAHAERLAREIALQQKIAQILTPDQRAQAREALANRPAGRGHRQGRNPAGVQGLLPQ